MSHISISSPFIRSFIHTDYTVGTSVGGFLAAAVTPERRTVVIIQNQSTTASIEVILNGSGTAGIYVAPLGSLTVDNYLGIVRMSASAASTPVHIAYATA